MVFALLRVARETDWRAVRVLACSEALEETWHALWIRAGSIPFCGPRFGFMCKNMEFVVMPNQAWVGPYHGE